MSAVGLCARVCAFAGAAEYLHTCIHTCGKKRTRAVVLHGGMIVCSRKGVLTCGCGTAGGRCCGWPGKAVFEAQLLSAQPHLIYFELQSNRHRLTRGGLGLTQKHRRRQTKTHRDRDNDNESVHRQGVSLTRVVWWGPSILWRPALRQILKTRKVTPYP